MRFLPYQHMSGAPVRFCAGLTCVLGAATAVALVVHANAEEEAARDTRAVARWLATLTVTALVSWIAAAAHRRRRESRREDRRESREMRGRERRR